MARRSAPLDPSRSPLATFGAEIRFRRETRNLSLDALGKIAGYSGSYIGMVERAEEMPTREVTEDLDSALGAGDTLLRLWDGLLKPGPFPSWFDWDIYEKQAVALRSNQTAVVYSQFQTRPYALALLNGDEEAATARIKRQEIRTDDDPPKIICVLDYSVLLREVGSKEIMRHQLQHLAKLALEEKNHVFITKFCKHEGTQGSFVIATLRDRGEVAYTETAIRGLTTAQPDELRILSDRFEDIRTKTLSEDESIELVLRTAEERWT